MSLEKKMSECQTKAGNQECFGKTFTTFTTFTLSFALSRHAEQVLFSCLGSKVTVYSRKLQWDFLGHPHRRHPIPIPILELVPS